MTLVASTSLPTHVNGRRTGLAWEQSLDVNSGAGLAVRGVLARLIVDRETSSATLSTEICGTIISPPDELTELRYANPGAPLEPIATSSLCLETGELPQNIRLRRELAAMIKGRIWAESAASDWLLTFRDAPAVHRVRANEVEKWLGALESFATEAHQSAIVCAREAITQTLSHGLKIHQLSAFEDDGIIVWIGERSEHPARFECFGSGVAVAAPPLGSTARWLWEIDDWNVDLDGVFEDIRRATQNLDAGADVASRASIGSLG